MTTPAAKTATGTAPMSESRSRNCARYRAKWEPGLDAPLGRYRFLVTAKHYRLRSATFRLLRSRNLRAKLVDSAPGRAVIALRNPVAVENHDLTWRPPGARIASVGLDGAAANAAIVGRRAVITGAPGTTVTIRPGRIRDPNGNHNRSRLELTL
jgi:hypothetical protein